MKVARSMSREIHISQKDIGSYKKLDLPMLEASSGLTLFKKMEFLFWKFPIYKNKRGAGKRPDDTFSPKDRKLFSLI
ncbi:hypothetical protein HanRHA438_Chr17g0837731 [Helianthus annuus]|nr:hypothetical protein HanRHA438_Chr17g0837731 [Helianthus annuus]